MRPLWTMDTELTWGTTTNPRKFCPPFDIPPIPSYSSHRVLSETPPCVDPLSNIWVIHTHSIHICTHMLSYAFICTSYALIWTNGFTTRVHMYPYVLHMSTYVLHMHPYVSPLFHDPSYASICDTYVLIWRAWVFLWLNIDSPVYPVASYGYPGGHGGGRAN